MKKEKVILFIIIVLVILVICIAGILITIKKEVDSRTAQDETIIEIEEGKNITQVTSRNNFYMVQSGIEKFYTYYSEMFKDPLDGYLIKPEEGSVNVEKLKNENIQQVYSILAPEYLQYKGITLENIKSILPRIGNISINIKDMYYITNEQKVSTYFVYGTKKDSQNSELTNFKVMVKIDLKNRTYKILLDDYVENFYKDFEIGKYIEIKEKEIKNDEYNMISYQHITDEDYIKDVFSHYKNMLRESKQQTYNLLDENYQKRCFENMEEYLAYINSNYSKIITAKLEAYAKTSSDKYTQYFLKDTKGNYYIFKETAPFKYTVMLDNYSIPTQDFIKEYNQSSAPEKVALNIKRFFMGIDNKNYGYSYSVLSEGFKSNKYPSKNDFINYVKQNFFEENKIEYISYEKENNLYIYKIKVSDATGKNDNVKELSIIVKLNEGTNFEMSFGTE